jgi:hypothetical protein
MSIGPKIGCWTCGEPDYQRDFSVERARVVGSVEQTTIEYLGKPHQIHAVVNNHQAEHHSTVLEMLGNIVDQTFSILIDLGATEKFIFGAALKRIKVKAVKQDKSSYVGMASRAK